MYEEPLISIFEEIGNGQCYKCGGPLAAVDLEADYMALDSRGFPTNMETLMSKCEGVCLNCGTRIPLVRSGVGYKYYSKVAIAMSMEDSLKELSHDEPATKNPFINVLTTGLQGKE